MVDTIFFKYLSDKEKIKYLVTFNINPEEYKYYNIRFNDLYNYKWIKKNIFKYKSYITKLFLDDKRVKKITKEDFPNVTELTLGYFNPQLDLSLSNIKKITILKDFSQNVIDKILPINLEVLHIGENDHNRSDDHANNLTNL